MKRSAESADGVRAAAGWAFERPKANGTRLGISFSGGGIRSATFALGVYQRLAEEGIFRRARFLSAVSGGGYLACALAISRAMSPEGALGDPPPWGRGSPEAARLRSHLSYLAPEGEGRLWLGANVLYGVILNLAPLILATYVLGHVEGFVLQQLYPGIGGDSVDVSAVPAVVAAIGAAVALAIVAVGWRRFYDKSRPGLQAPPRRGAPRAATQLLMLALAATGLLVVMPLVVHVLAGWTPDVVDALGVGSLPWRVQRILLGLIGVFASLGLGLVALWMHQRRTLQVLRSVLAAIAGGLVLLIPFTLATETGAVLSWSFERDGRMLIIAAIVILLFAVFAHNRRYSMHLFYRERIQEAFALRRCPGPRTCDFDVEPVPYEQRILLSEVAAANQRRTLSGEDEPFPELIVCAAVAARAPEVPSKAWAASFPFEGKSSGNRRLGLQAPTRKFEDGDWIGGGGLTLPSMMAISGAALSPLMGRLTLPAFRFLMAVMNIRLGVWLRNPSAKFDAALPPRSRPFARAWSYVVRGWREPGAWYVLKEGLGLAGARGKFIYVSDGGHWENLGLTELLRRRCSDIVAIDASGTATLGDIGRAMAVARAELGIEFTFDPRGTAPGDDGLASSPVAVGFFHYPDGQKGTIVLARCVLWNEAPPDLQLFAEEDRFFPNHPTANQFLSGDVFDAYRALGYSVGGVVAEKLKLLPPEDQDEPPTADRVVRIYDPAPTAPQV